MKHLKQWMFLCALAFSATVSAQSYSYLTLHRTSGNETSLKLEGLKITFSDGNLVATNGAGTVLVPLSEMSRMFFSATPTGMQSVSASDGFHVSIVNGTLHANVPAGVPVKVYGTDGRLMPTTGLKPGVYVVKAGSQTLKILAR